MRRALSLDTSTWWGGLALVEGDGAEAPPRLVAELGILVRDSHSVHLMGWIEQLLAIAGWSRSSLDAYVATRGPGSFTGIRIGLGTVRGLAVATGRPCVGISTLEAMAEAHGPADLERAPVIDAGRGEWFAAVYDASSTPPQPVIDPWVGPVADVLAASLGRLVLPGPAGRTAALLAAGAGGEVRYSRAVRGVAAAAARLALLRGEGEAGEPESVSPIYVRPSDAELNVRRR